MGIISERMESLRRSAQLCDSPPFPKVLMVEPTNGCNLRCVFCENSSSARRPTLLDFQLAGKILDDAYAAGAREVGFYLTGEPFLNPHLAAMVAVAKRIGFTYIYLTSNGVLATPERVRELVDSGLDSIKFSINAGDAETYREIHGRDAFGTVMHNLQSCIELRRRQAMAGGDVTRLLVSCVYVNEPTPGHLALREDVSALVDDFLLLPANVEGHFRVRQRYGQSCLQPFTRVHVTAEGYMTVCCSDFHNVLVIADLNRESISDAWSGTRFREFRSRFMRDSLDGTLCGRCQYGCEKTAVPLLEWCGDAP